MKIQIPTVKEVEVKFVRLVLPVNYDEEEIPDDFPFRKEEVWEATIDIDTGAIQNWPKGKAVKMHLTVKDEGSYYVLDEHGKTVLLIESEYVPHCLIPGSYGDVVLLDIDENGIVTNWPKKPTFGAFIDEDED